MIDGLWTVNQTTNTAGLNTEDNLGFCWNRHIVILSNYRIKNKHINKFNTDLSFYSNLSKYFFYNL